MNPVTLKLGIVIYHGTQDQSLYVEFPATAFDHLRPHDLFLAISGYIFGCIKIL